MKADRKFELKFAYGLGKPPDMGRFKQFPEDFVVVEIPSYVMSGEGEHALLEVRKRGCNTEWVAQQLARFAQIRTRDVGYAGRKDRHAETTQWFSCWLPGRSDPNWQDLDIDNVDILKVGRHNRKLRPGALKANRFNILLRDIETHPDKHAWMEQRLSLMKEKGVPNYFGSQRFGVGANNLIMADRLFRGDLLRKCHKQGIYLSAARSWLFNQALSKRIIDGQWGERKSDGGSKIGSLFGLGEFDKDEDAFIRGLEPEWCDALIRLKMKRSFRALTMDPLEFQWEFPEVNQLRLQFTLPRGCYATALIRELIDIPESQEMSGEE